MAPGKAVTKSKALRQEILDQDFEGDPYSPIDAVGFVNK